MQGLKTNKQIAAALNITPPQVARIRKLLTTKKGQATLLNTIRPTNATKITNLLIEQCQQYVDNTPPNRISRLSLKKHLARINPNQKPPSLFLLSKIFKKHLQISYQKASSRPITTTTALFAERRRDVSDVILGLDAIDQEIVFIDEYSFNCSAGRQYRWAPRGKGGSIISQLKTKSWTMIVAINRRGLIHM
jgi:hypothetical protein